MLVRFNKGPWHRKVRDVDLRDVERGTINIALYDAKAAQRTFTNNANSYLTVAPGHKIAIYTIKMMTLHLSDGPRQVPSVFPDGPICFEYKETI